MATINIKKLKEKVLKMLSAWLEGAADIIFKGIKRGDLEAKWLEAETTENELAERRAQVTMLEDKLDKIYSELNIMTVKVRDGVAGDEKFGDDSVLYGAMGYVRKSERRSGLTRKKTKKPE